MSNDFTPIETNKPLQYFILISGILIGWFGSFYITRHLYQYTGCLCIFGIHFHHLYFGIILFIIFLILYLRCKKPITRLYYLFFLGFAIGIFTDDLFDHFIFKMDGWEFFCGEYCYEDLI